MRMGEHPCRSPAAVVSLRPVTLRPCLSVSLPSDYTLMSGSNKVNLYKTNGYVFGLPVTVVKVNPKPDEPEPNAGLAMPVLRLLLNLKKLTALVLG